MYNVRRWQTNKKLNSIISTTRVFDGEQIIDIQMKNLQTGVITISGKVFIWGEVKILPYTHINAPIMF